MRFGKYLLKMLGITAIVFCLTTARAREGNEYFSGFWQAKQQWAVVSGAVFLDENRNGRQDGPERGLPDVLVSNGREFAITDENGEYDLIVSSEELPCVFVVRKSGYTLTTPFYHLLQDCHDVANADFGFVPDAAAAVDRFQFVHVTDLHFAWLLSSGAGGDALIRRFVAFLKSFPAAFIANCGDTACDLHQQLSEGQRLLGPLAAKLYNIPGNHDYIDVPGSKGDYGRRFMDLRGIRGYVEYFGPAYYAFNFGPYHFIVLVSFGSGSLLEKWQNEWLKQDVLTLPPSAKIIVLTHDPASSVIKIPDLAQTIHDLAGRRHIRLIAAFLGHIHNDTVTRTNGVSIYTTRPALNSGFLADFPGFRVVTVEPDKITTRLYFSSGTASNELPWGTNLAAVIGGDRPGPSLKPGNDWPVFQHDACRSGVSEDIVKPPLKIAWAKNVGTGLAAPVIAGNRVYLSIRDDENGTQGGVAALDATNGELIWKYVAGDSVYHSPAVSGDEVYFVTTHGCLRAVTADKGVEKWRYQEDAKIQTYSSPLLVGDKIYSGKTCLDRLTGKVLWRGPDRLPHSWCASPSSPASDGTNIYYGFTWAQGMCAFSLTNGAALWNWNTKEGFITAAFLDTPAISSASVFLSANERLYALDAATGRQKWSFPLGLNRSWPMMPVSSAAVKDGMVVAGSEGDGKIFGLQMQDGKLCWEFQTGKSLLPYGSYGNSGAEGDRFRPGVLASPVISGRTAYVGANDGIFYALDIYTGKKIWQRALGIPIVSAAAISGNAVYVRALDGTLFALVGNYKF